MSERAQHRGKMINITIDEKVCQGIYGETILDIARANEIDIPTMCYLPKVAPITACRMCLVEVQGVDGLVLSCQEKALDGAVITTNTKELFEHRQNIMKMYNLNDFQKSNDSKLQNMTKKFEIDSQKFEIEEPVRKEKKWGILGYDENLCIMCERCVRTCNEVNGSIALYVKPGGYKSAIDIKMSLCEQCGECISVCPVKALVSNEYDFSANINKSQKVPATCAHCSSGCSLYYEINDEEVENSDQKKITGVTNDSDFNELCGAGRFAFSFENEDSKKDPSQLQKAVEAIKSSDTIKFNSYITNEEAFILQRLKEKLGIKLINHDALNFQNFIKSYESISEAPLYDGTHETIRQSDSIIMIGTRITRDNPVVKYSSNIAIKKQWANFIYMHPIDDVFLQNKYNQFVKYEVGSEEGVMALLASYLIQDTPSELKAYFDDLDIGYLSGECSVGEEEFESIVTKLIKSNNKTLILGEDLYGHPRASQIAKLAGAINRYTDFKVVMIPSQTNTLGVSLICEIDTSEGQKVVGYNEQGDFIMSNTGVGDIQIPALNQQNGTFVNLDKKVLNTNVALDFNGYCLNDIANEILDDKYTNTVQYTSKLPKNKGFKKIDFNSLNNGFDHKGKDQRGYDLDLSAIQKTAQELSLDEVADIESYNGTVVYRCEPLHQFNKSTEKSLLLKTDTYLRGSAAFATAAKIKDRDEVNIRYNNRIIKKVFKIDKKIKGTVALYPTFDNHFHDDPIEVGYRFKKVQIQKVEA